MIQSKPRFLTFDEYLSYDDGTEQLYELFNGELIEVPPESGKNVAIATYLLLKFAEIMGHLRVRGHGLELEVRGEPKNRYPDLTIIREEHVSQLASRNTIRLSMAPPHLVIEVVSPGELQREPDYQAKRQQYETIDIPEYWIVDPEEQHITVLRLTERGYQEVGVFQAGEAIAPADFPELQLNVKEIFAAGTSDL